MALLPDDLERQRQELEFWSALGAVLLIVKGFAAPETGAAYARARELWEQLGSSLEFLRIPFGQSLYHAVRGELDLALHFAEDLLRLSRQRKDSAGLVLGYLSSGLNLNLMYGGRFASSQSHLEEAFALYDPISHRSLVLRAGFHPQVVLQAYLGIVLFCLGFPDQALAQSNAAIAESRRLAHPPSLAGILSLRALLFSLVGDDAALGKWADQLVAVTTEQGFSYCRAGENRRGPQMKALCWHGKHDMRCDTVPDPQIEHPRDAIIKVTACAICGSDLHIYDGMIPSMERGDVLGHETMGEVVEVGSEKRRSRSVTASSSPLLSPVANASSANGASTPVARGPTRTTNELKRFGGTRPPGWSAIPICSAGMPAARPSIYACLSPMSGR